MKKLAVWLMLAVMFFAVISGGCGGGSDSTDPEQVESLKEDTGDYDPNSGGCGTNGATVDLSTIKAAYIAQDGDLLTGKLGANVKVSIADCATITLKDAAIDGVNLENCEWAGISCLGDATIILEGMNYVKGFEDKYPGIHVPEGRTLTIKGYGYLDASSNGWGAGIGGGYKIPYGNIVIEGGTINATGTRYAAAIGGGWLRNCGNITITDTAQKVIARRYTDLPYTPNSIGAGTDGTCGTVTIAAK